MKIGKENRLEDTKETLKYFFERYYLVIYMGKFQGKKYERVNGHSRMTQRYRKWRYHNDPEYRKKVLEYSRKSSKKYYRKHKAEVIEKISRHKRKRLLKYKKLVFQKLGNKCANPFNLPHYPWNNDPQILQVDHINDDGRKDPLRTADYGQYYKKILEHLESDEELRYQLLCPNCNWLKRLQHHE